MRIIDAHSHLNLKAENPLCDLLSEMDLNHVERALLILNLPEERNAFKHEFELYLANKERIAISYGLDLHKIESKIELDEALNKIGDKIVIKIHPKLFNIVREEVPLVIESLREYKGIPVMVDSLYYGEDIENHIGLDLSVALAREYSDRNIIVAHSGSLDFLKCMMACRYIPHVFFDYSFIQSFFNHTSLRLDMVNFLSRTSNRILFGSDRPSFKLDRTILDFIDIAKESGISESQLDDVMYGNALGLYW